jgi:hypothetical protein
MVQLQHLRGEAVTGMENNCDTHLTPLLISLTSLASPHSLHSPHATLFYSSHSPS